MDEFKLENILDDDAVKGLDKLARLHELCKQLMNIEEELRKDYSIGLEIIELDHV